MRLLHVVAAVDCWIAACRRYLPTTVRDIGEGSDASVALCIVLLFSCQLVHLVAPLLMIWLLCCVCCRPGKPFVVSTTTTSILIEWDVVPLTRDGERPPVEYFQVQVRTSSVLAGDHWCRLCPAKRYY